MTENKEQVETQEQETPNLAGFLKDFDGAPSQSEIEKWKQQHGEVFVSGFSETELFVWRALDRLTYVNLQKKMKMQQPQSQEEAFTELEFEQSVVEACVLWSSNGNVLSSKGGSISTLSEQIMLNSNFMAPALASQLVMKL